MVPFGHTWHLPNPAQVRPKSMASIEKRGTPPNALGANDRNPGATFQADAQRHFVARGVATGHIVAEVHTAGDPVNADGEPRDGNFAFLAGFDGEVENVRVELDAHVRCRAW